MLSVAQIESEFRRGIAHAVFVLTFNIFCAVSRFTAIDS